MPRLLTRERFRGPQFAAAVILLAFLGQCVWFCSRVPLTDREIGFTQISGHSQDFTFSSPSTFSSPMTGLAASLPVVLHAENPDSRGFRWLVRLPFLIAGVLFGASIWYVARRLFGDSGGYVALLLYAFSPWFIIHSAIAGPEIIAGWAAFGAIFTAIGVAHTLYAPREVILWNWKRILLLGAALGVGCGANQAVLLIVPIALLFMWYLVPERMPAALAIMLAACGVAGVIEWAIFGLHAKALWFAMRNSITLLFTSHSLSAPVTWKYALDFFLFQEPMLAILLVAALVVFTVWKRARFFGTAAPLIVFLFLIAMGFLSFTSTLPLYLMAVPFAFVFIAGIMADLLESRYASVSLGVVVCILAGHIIISVAGLLGV
jgi:4-amino-4-deoxy-L-arabinose transferase-like glycosyltransferase